MKLRTAFTVIMVSSLFLLTRCADTPASVSTQPATVVARASGSSLPVVGPAPTDTPVPPSTITPTATLPSFSTLVTTASPAPTQPPSSGNSPRIMSFTAEKTQENSVVFSWHAIGIRVYLCPLVNSETLSYDCKSFFYTGDETVMVGSEIWPAAEIGAPYTGFKLSVEGVNGAVETAEMAISGLVCAHTWFFGNPTERCPAPSMTSLASAQRFEHGQMIWVKKLDKFYIFYDSGLQAWPTNLDIVGSLTLKPNASVDNRTGEKPRPGFMEPIGNFGLLWRGEVEYQAALRDRLGWATEPEIRFETIYQCGVGSDPLGCLPNYLQELDGKILNLYYLMHFGYYWQEQFNWEAYSNTEYGYAIKYPDFLIYSREAYTETGGVVTRDKWSPSDQSYAVYILSYEAGVNPALEFLALVTSDETTQVGGLEARKLVGTEFVADKGTLIHIGPVSYKGNDHMLIYSSGSHVADPGSIEIFYQMLATFHFTDSP